MLAVIHKLRVAPDSPAPESEVAPPEGSDKVVAAVTNEDLSKRMEKMEETMAALLSMVGKLQEVILTSAAIRET
ncbi:hypothetical protein TRAPUB_4654 [Trametes pubescens]|uniref:Uncharacterized protein n=1 Tax=Trametes pubescens TaxID=154538 RepID=A0A1M2VAN0_TRAPU|nr:hypothetical protein TRAPUB_4654 [Trametes pubescens]